LWQVTQNMLKKDKPELIQKLSKQLADAKSVVLVDFAGLTVKLQQELKKRLKESSSSMLIVKNTLFKLAANEAKLPRETLTDSVLTGQTAIVTSSHDSVTPIQVLGKFSKEFDQLRFKVGVVDGEFQDNTSLVKISTLPGIDILLAQVLGCLASPSFSLVGVLKANMQKLIYILSEYTKNKASSTKIGI